MSMIKTDVFFSYFAFTNDPGYTCGAAAIVCRVVFCKMMQVLDSVVFSCNTLIYAKCVSCGENLVLLDIVCGSLRLTTM